MAIKGTDIAKKLPDGGKKNCKECGFPTCFAFAMKLASLNITPNKCPYLSEDVKAELADALAPPIKLVTVGVGENAISVGEEEVLFRHEKTFFRPPGIAVLITDTETDEEISAKIKKIKDLQFPWIGMTLKANLLALKCGSGNKDKFLNLVNKVKDENFPLILIADDLGILFSARDVVADKKPLLSALTKDNLEKALPRVKENPTPVVISVDKIEDIIPISSKLKEEGLDNIFLNTNPKNLRDIVRDNTFIRRSGLQGIRALGYPIINLPCDMTKDKIEEILLAEVGVVKYSGIIVLSDIDKDTLLPLLITRMNIYTDPRKPLMVEEKIYEIGNATEEAMVLVTTNFALTYFAVAGEIEATKIPSFLCIKDTEGLCVLAAWSTAKFTGDAVGAFIKKCGIQDKVKNKRIIIPGLAARIKGELEDELPGWEVIVGPREASDLSTFLPKIAARK